MTKRIAPTFSRAVADLICERVSTGETLRSVCRDEKMPGESTVRGWVLQDLDGFAAQYARARMLQGEAWADEIVEIADDGASDVWTDDKGVEHVRADVIARSRLSVDTRKWLLSKLHHKQYGDKLELGSDPKNPLIVQIVRFGDS